MTAFYELRQYRIRDGQRERWVAFMEDKIFCEGQQARIDERGESHLVDIVSDATRVQLRRIIKKMFDEEQKQPATASAPTARVEIPITVAK